MSADGKIHFRCPNCDKAVRVPQQFAGKRGKCPGCGAEVRIPAPASPAAREKEPPAVLGVLIAKYGDAVYGDETAYKPGAYLGRLSLGDDLLLLREALCRDQYGNDLVLVKVAASRYTSDAGTVGWVALASTSFAPRFGKESRGSIDRALEELLTDLEQTASWSDATTGVSALLAVLRRHPEFYSAGQLQRLAGLKLRLEPQTEVIESPNIMCTDYGHDKVYDYVTTVEPADTADLRALAAAALTRHETSGAPPA